ncbi:MAG: hypothetical protein MK010_03420, partial [Erythrobacter sp.]|nr:hypothetical protein [Erythrobacter sp.]
MIWLTALAMIAIPAQGASALQGGPADSAANSRVEIGQVSAERGRDIAIDQAPHSESREAAALEQALPIGSRAISGGQIGPDGERG